GHIAVGHRRERPAVAVGLRAAHVHDRADRDVPRVGFEIDVTAEAGAVLRVALGRADYVPGHGDGAAREDVEAAAAAARPLGVDLDRRGRGRDHAGGRVELDVAAVEPAAMRVDGSGDGDLAVVRRDGDVASSAVAVAARDVDRDRARTRDAHVARTLDGDRPAVGIASRAAVRPDRTGDVDGPVDG